MCFSVCCIRTGLYHNWSVLVIQSQAQIIVQDEGFTISMVKWLDCEILQNSHAALQILYHFVA